MNIVELKTKQDLIDVLIANEIIISAEIFNKMSYYHKMKKCERLVKLYQYDENFAFSVGKILAEFDQYPIYTAMTKIRWKYN